MEFEKIKHINTPIISRTSKYSFSNMYKIHRYWSKKSSDIISEYIKTYTEPNDIILDPFCGSGITICEAVRLNRKAIGIDLNPMATFITKMTLLPLNLSNFHWSFKDIEEKSKEVIYELYTTRCNNCNRKATVDFFVKEYEMTKLIAYKCKCSRSRLFKYPDEKDFGIEKSISRMKIPFWYPVDVKIPKIRSEKFEYLHELFTKRNLIALSIILNSINGITDEKIRQIMKLTFTAALDKCSKLKPLASKCKEKGELFPNLQESWVAIRFYLPKKWLEVNPWQAFERSFERVYLGKKESNKELKNAVVGYCFKDLIDGKANYIIYNGSTDTVIKKYLPPKCIDYIITDPPYGDNIKYLALSTFWGSWLKFDFNYNDEVVVNELINKTSEDYNKKIKKIFKYIGKIIKNDNYINTFYEGIKEPYFHNLLRSMIENNILPEKIIYQPPASSFGTGIRNKGIGNYGSYIIRGKKSFRKDNYPGINTMKKKILKIANKTLDIRNVNEITTPVLYRSIYQNLDSSEIQTISKYDANRLIIESLRGHFSLKGNVAKRENVEGKNNTGQKIRERIEKAVLYAKSIYKDKKNQVYQIVLKKLYLEGVTIDDIRSVINNINDEMVKKYRKNRFLKIIRRFGEILDYEIIEKEDSDEIIWKRENKKVSFLIEEKGIKIKASRSGIEKMSDIGIITYEKFEYSIIKWFKNNPKEPRDLLNNLIQVYNEENLKKPINFLKLKVLNNIKLCKKHYLIELKWKDSSLSISPGQFLHVICDPSGDKETFYVKIKNRDVVLRKKILSLLPRELKDFSRGLISRNKYFLALRRPFSIHRIHYKNFDRRLLDSPKILPDELKEAVKRPIDKIDILYKDVGRGTKKLSMVKPGTYLNVIGPIGNGFNIKYKETAIIIAGGIGAAPLVALAEQLRYYGIDVYLYFGGISKEILKSILLGKKQKIRDSTIEYTYANGDYDFANLIYNEFKEIGAKYVKISTDDGSMGEKGYISEIFESELRTKYPEKDKITIYACGPSEMISEISRIAHENKIRCMVLLEERMACGIGACYSCTCDTRDKNGNIIKKRVCVDGPVFNSEEISWEN